jgi:hypothetical protein
MFRASTTIFAAVSLSTGVLLLACGGSGSDDSGSSQGAMTGNDSQSSTSSSGSSSGSSGSSSGSSGSSSGSSGSSSGSSGSQAPQLKANSLTYDGAPCTVGRTDFANRADGRSWTLLTNAKCPASITLNITGVIDAPYPQEDLTAPTGDPAAVLFGTATFTSAPSGGASSITTGPTSAALAAVKGSATVVDPQGGSESHTVTYDFGL